MHLCILFFIAVIFIVVILCCVLLSCLVYSVALFSCHQVSDGDQLLIRQRIPKQPAVRQHSLADVALDLPTKTQKSPQRDLKRILSEPLFNHLREKLYKIRKKRAASEPVSLDAIRQRKVSLQNPLSFQIGEQTGKKKCLKKVYSLDSAEGTDGKTVMPPQHSSSRSLDQLPEDETIVTKISNEAEKLSAHPPPEEKHDPHSSVGK